jgi:hypothetical protein
MSGLDLPKAVVFVAAIDPHTEADYNVFQILYDDGGP